MLESSDERELAADPVAVESSELILDRRLASADVIEAKSDDTSLLTDETTLETTDETEDATEDAELLLLLLLLSDVDV